MKVKCSGNVFECIKSSDKMSAVESVKQYMDERGSAKDFARAVSKYLFKLSNPNVLLTTAQITVNNRIWNFYGENSANVDVWLTFIVFNDVPCINDEEFIIAGIYFSDYMRINLNAPEDIRLFMHVDRFKCI